jgi:hypothetical protein
VAFFSVFGRGNTQIGDKDSMMLKDFPRKKKVLKYVQDTVKGHVALKVSRKKVKKYKLGAVTTWKGKKVKTYKLESKTKWHYRCPREDKVTKYSKNSTKWN